MLAEKTRSIIDKSKRIYESIQGELEAHHNGQYIAIEPDSGNTFIAGTFDGAVEKARAAYPGRVTHTIRIGKSAAFHIGLMEQ